MAQVKVIRGRGPAQLAQEINLEFSESAEINNENNHLIEDILDLHHHNMCSGSTGDGEG